MTKNKRTVSTLEAINQQFAENQKQIQPEQTRTGSFFSRFGRVEWLAVGMITAAAILVIICLWLLGQVETTKPAKSLLTKDEQEQWVSQAAEEEIIPIELNTRIEVQGDRALIRLLNPVYSAYPIKVRILKEEGEQVLYESERLAPGTVLESVPLIGLGEGKEEEFDADVEYTVYEDQVVKGSYLVPVKLIRQDK